MDYGFSFFFGYFLNFIIYDFFIIVFIRGVVKIFDLK
jgi:hypothetical protein